MALPVNSIIEQNGVRLVVTDQRSSPSRVGGQNTPLPTNGADQVVNAYSGSPGSNVNYASSGRKGLKIPDFSGLDKALGVLGTAAAIGQGIAGLVSTGKNLLSKTTSAGAKGITENPAITEELQRAKDREAAIKSAGQFTPSIGSNLTDWRVKLNCNFDVFGPNPYFKLLKDSNGLVFPYTPNVTVTHKANYTQAEGLTHTNFPFAAYKNSQVDDITISTDFSVQNSYEGSYWIAAMLFLKSATKMFYGASQPQGFPPVVCRLQGYGSQIFNNVPVVVKSYQIELKDNVQYMNIPPIPGTLVESTWVPMSSQVTVTVMPMYNREKVRQFSLQDFARGKNNGVL